MLSFWRANWSRLHLSTRTLEDYMEAFSFSSSMSNFEFVTLALVSTSYSWFLKNRKVDSSEFLSDVDKDRRPLYLSIKSCAAQSSRLSCKILSEELPEPIKILAILESKYVFMASSLALYLSSTVTSARLSKVSCYESYSYYKHFIFFCKSSFSWDNLWL